MPFADMQSFVKALESRGQLKRITVEVDPVLEAGAIADRVSKMPAAGQASPPPTDPVHGGRGGHALYFAKPKGSSIPLVMNLYGSYERMRMALGVESFEALADRVQQLVKPEMPTTFLEKMKKLPQLAKMAGFAPKVVRSGICQQVVRTDKASFLDLPIIQCWPHDGKAGYGGKPSDEAAERRSDEVEGAKGQREKATRRKGDHGDYSKNVNSNMDGAEVEDGLGEASAQTKNEGSFGSAPLSLRRSVAPSLTSGTGRYITFAGIYTKDPETGERNVGMYRVQVHGPKLAAMHWHLHHDGARHCRKYKARGEKMPLAIVLGGESVLPYAATCPLPPDVSELLFAGFLNDGGIELVPCKTIPVEVPCNAEIVIEGWVDPQQMLIEGPFGDHTGFYSLADDYPAYHVTAITHRTEPIYPATIVGLPPQEDYYMGKATERIFLPLLKMLIPDIIDYSLPMFGAFHNCVFVKIRKEYPLQARKVMSSIWGAGQMMFSKMIVVVDEHVNVHDEQDVWFHVGANVDWRRDTVIVDGPCDILDHSTPYMGAGAKIGIDATRKIQGEGIVRDWPDELCFDDETLAKLTLRWREYGIGE